MSYFVPSAITQPFFELQTPDFAWKIVWTACRDPCKKNNFRDSLRKNLKLGKIKEKDITRSFFELHTPDFAWKFVWTACRDPTKKFNFRDSLKTVLKLGKMINNKCTKNCCFKYSSIFRRPLHSTMWTCLKLFDVQ